MLKSAILWSHDTVNSVWRSWLASTTHRVLLSTECSLTLKTWNGTKSIVCSRAFHHLTEFLHLILSPWGSPCVVSTYSMALCGSKSLGFFQWKPFQGMRSQAALCWMISSLPSCLLCCGSSCSASGTLPHGYCSHFLCWQPNAGLSDFGVSPLPEDWLSLLSQSTLGRQIHCHHCDVKFKGKKKQRKIGKYSSLIRYVLSEAPELFPGF